MAHDLQVKFKVVAHGIDFIEFEGDRAYCLHNWCETESKELVRYTNTLAYLLTHSIEYIFPHISVTYFVSIWSAYFLFKCHIKPASLSN